MALPVLTDTEHAQMRHALGLDQGKVAYRNRYVTNGRNEVWEGLCMRGVASRASFGDGDKWVYWVTDAGYQHVLQPGEGRQADLEFDHAN